jgi:hypothetical protein
MSDGDDEYASGESPELGELLVDFSVVWPADLERRHDEAPERKEHR